MKMTENNKHPASHPALSGIDVATPLAHFTKSPPRVDQRNFQRIENVSLTDIRTHPQEGRTLLEKLVAFLKDPTT